MGNVDSIEKILSFSKVQLRKYDLSKARPIYSSLGECWGIPKFLKALSPRLGNSVYQLAEAGGLLHNELLFEEALIEYAQKKKIYIPAKEEKVGIDIPDDFQNLELYYNLAEKEQMKAFFLANKDTKTISRVSGTAYMMLSNMAPKQAVALAKPVFVDYLPRNPPGISKIVEPDKGTYDCLNSYVPAEWTNFEGKVPDKLPALFEKLCVHLFPSKIEREYFYSWLHASLFDRAFVYLILCGAPGVGKNRLKLVIRALHGEDNSIDGKRSTLSERFNSQLSDCTYAHFDELTYNQDMENNMKEVQNDSISIERKGVDATRATRIYASMLISNNKPRDNFIAFDARKFVPLQLTSQRLEASMTPDEITALTGKVENRLKPTYDLAFIAQIGRWIKKHGKSKKWPNLEYRGPMFYKLAHISMSRWQKKAADAVLNFKPENNAGVIYDPEKGILWSSLSEKLMKRATDKSTIFADHTSVNHFFKVFLDDKGRSAFETTSIPGNHMHDFYVKSIVKKVHLTSNDELEEEMSEGEFDESDL